MGVSEASDEKQKALQLWWQVSAVSLQRKLAKKQFIRTLLDVDMFVYMGIARKVALALPCRTIGGMEISMIDTSKECSGWLPTDRDSIARFVSLLVFLGFNCGFPMYILWRLDLHSFWRKSQQEAAASWKAGRFTTTVDGPHRLHLRPRAQRLDGLAPLPQGLPGRVLPHWESFVGRNPLPLIDADVDW